jgi:2-C-methyl-D-erythritol 4-phosphate cytidylyltransferase
MERQIIAIVPAAGLGKRFDASGEKTFIELDGIPLLIHTLKRLQAEPLITDIVPVLRQEDIEKGFSMADEYGINKIKHIAPGGKERQDSIYNALRLIEETGGDSYRESLIMIHDGARPVIPEGTIEKLSDEIKDVDGAAPGIPARDTLKKISEDGAIITTVNREDIRAIQTPQAFLFKVIKEAYDLAYRDNFYATDDAALVERMGGKVRIIEGSPLNIKITTPEDLEMVKYILTKKEL